MNDLDFNSLLYGDSKALLDSTLLLELERVLPGAQLFWKTMPFEQSVELQLLDFKEDTLKLSSEQVGVFWQNLPYWAFAWAAGQGLANYILNNPQLVKGKRVLDFGCGSGLVGIAAAKSGAASVLCCDSDPIALLACKANALRNGVDIDISVDWQSHDDPLDCLLAGDVLYDLTSSGDLASQCEVIPCWIIAETEYQLPPWSNLKPVQQYTMSTLPRVEDFDQSLLVSIYKTE